MERKRRINWKWTAIMLGAYCLIVGAQYIIGTSKFDKYYIDTAVIEAFFIWIVVAVLHYVFVGRKKFLVNRPSDYNKMLDELNKAEKQFKEGAKE